MLISFKDRKLMKCMEHGSKYSAGCVSCRLSRNEYRSKNLEKQEEYRKKWLSNNPGYFKKWRDKNRNKLKDRHREWLSLNPEKQEEYRKKWLADHPEYIKAYLVRKARQRSRKKGIPGTIRMRDIEWPKYCPILGTELDYTTVSGARHRIAAKYLPSLDRKDNTQGYVPGNVMVISWRANSLKSDMSVDEIYALWKYMNDGR